MATLLPAKVSFSEEDVKTIKDCVLPRGANDAELKLFLAQSMRTGLDPLSRQIYAFKFGDKMSIGISIDGMRVIAERTNKYAGQEGPYWCGPDGEWKEVWLDKVPPAAAKVGVIRTDFKNYVWGVARFDAYRQQSAIWTKMPEHMLAKCAEMLALRKAFPNDLSGLYGKEELGTEEIEMVESSPELQPRVKASLPPPESQPATKPVRRTSNRTETQGSVALAPTEDRLAVVASPAPVRVLEVVPEDKAETQSSVEASSTTSANADVSAVTVTEAVAPAAEPTVTPEELLEFCNFGIAQGYDEQKISDFLAVAYGINEETVLSLTKKQLAEAREHFKELLEFYNFGIAQGYSEEEINEHLTKAYAITEETVLSLTKNQLQEARAHFKPRTRA